MTEPDRGRFIAQDISEGLNCLAGLRTFAKTNASPPPECLAELDALENAFQGIRNGEVHTDFVADDGLMATVREVRGLVSDWLVHDKCSPAVVPQIEGLLARMGITAAFLDSSS